jgi:TonB family protein
VPLAEIRTEVLLPPKPPVVQAKVQPAPPPPQEQPEERIPEPPQRVARVIAPRTITPPKLKPVEVRREVLPQLNQALAETKFEIASAAPPRPREPVKTGLITTGSAAPATVNLPLAKVQTGGFGDPQGLPGEGDPNKRANIARAGSPALPSGPGYGNGTGGANGVRGTVASAGFGNGVAIPPPGGSNVARGEVKSGGFASATLDSAAPKPKPAEIAAALQPVVILEKQNPVYTAEAKKLGIEGDVTVEVVFPASGPVRVIRVIKGLGHGLDEAATRVAGLIRFKPALQNGQPVDFPATVRITFQIAY